MRALALVGSAALFALSCSAPPPERTATTSTPIQSGQLDTAHDFVVGVLAQLGGGVSGLCTGTLLAPNLVVTARHCVAPPAGTTVDCNTATFGSQVAASRVNVVDAPTFDQTNPDPQQLVPVSEIVTPQSQALCGNDIALLVLRRGIQLDAYAEPTFDPPMTDHAAYSTSVTEIGYGLDSPTDMTSAGVRRIRQNVGLVCIPNDSGFNDCFADQAIRSMMSASEFQSGDGTCEGDSGSPAFDQKGFDAGRWLSFGVLSRGATQGTTCSTAVYTRFDAWASLLVMTAQHAAAVGGYPVPSWTTNPVATDPPSSSGGGHSGCSVAMASGRTTRSTRALVLATLMAAALVLLRRRRRAAHLSGNGQQP